MKRVGQIFAMHTDLECGQKYHKHDANFNLLSGKKCRKDKLTDHLNNGKSQLNQEMIPQREKKNQLFQGSLSQPKSTLVFLAIVINARNLNTGFPSIYWLPNSLIWIPSPIVWRRRKCTHLIRLYGTSEIEWRGRSMVGTLKTFWIP